jgi:hypothetical protein
MKLNVHVFIDFACNIVLFCRRLKKLQTGRNNVNIGNLKECCIGCMNNMAIVFIIYIGRNEYIFHFETSAKCKSTTIPHNAIYVYELDPW